MSIKPLGPRKVTERDREYVAKEVVPHYHDKREYALRVERAAASLGLTSLQIIALALQVRQSASLKKE